MTGFDFALDVEKFQEFIFEMDDVLENFVKEALSLGFGLDYSISSLDGLESYIDSVGEGTVDVRFLSRCARYVGEVFRKELGGGWDLSIENPKDINFKLPVIRHFSELDLDFSPFSVVGNYCARRKRGLLKGAVVANCEFSKSYVAVDRR